MALSSPWGPELDQMLRAQSAASAAQSLGGRLAVRDSMLMGTGGRPWDPKGARRAAKMFGLRGGELCGCHKPGCRTCASDGSFGDEVCGCAAFGCPKCTPPWSAPRLRLRRKRGGKASFGADLTFLGPWEGSFEAESSYFCIHSHLTVSTRADYENTLDTSYGGTTDIDERIAMLESLQPDYGVGRLVVSAMVGSSSPDPSMDGLALDVMAAYAYSVNPSYFVPFVRGFDIDAPSLFWIELCLAFGFRGIGELFCYGYGNELANFETLVPVCQLAARYSVPVAVHWEIGNRAVTVPTDPSAPVRTPVDVSWTYLLDLLAALPPQQLETYVRTSEDDPLPFKLILCHCGSGPDVVEDPAMMATYEARLTTLLVHYPNVYFDMAGMQGPSGAVLYLTDSTGATLTPLGILLAEKLLAYPDRFLFGVDTTENSGAEFERWAETIPNYETFLSLAGITDPEILEKFRYNNAVRVLYSRPPTVTTTPTTTHSSTPLDWPGFGRIGPW